MKDIATYSPKKKILIMYYGVKISFVILALFSILPYAHAATFTVNDLGDAGDANPGDGIAETSTGVTTLRAAVEEANYAADTDEITFDPTLFPTPKTINFSKHLHIIYDLILTGPGAELLTISGQDACQIFKVYGDHEAEFTISRLTLAHGYSPMTGEYAGGAIIAHEHTTLQINNCVFQENYAEYGGGACWIIGVSEISQCKFIDNWSDGPGGALLFEDISTTIISKCMFSNNSAPYASAGAVSILQFTDARVLSCTFSNNSARYFGGAINCSGHGNFYMINSSLLSNHANHQAGGISLGAKGISMMFTVIP